MTRNACKGNTRISISMRLSIKCGDHLSHTSGKWLYIHDLPRGSLRSLRKRTRLYPGQRRKVQTHGDTIFEPVGWKSLLSYVCLGERDIALCARASMTEGSNPCSPAGCLLSIKVDNRARHASLRALTQPRLALAALCQFEGQNPLRTSPNTPQERENRRTHYFSGSGYSALPAALRPR